MCILYSLKVTCRNFISTSIAENEVDYRLCLAGAISLLCHHSQLLKKCIMHLDVCRKIVLLNCGLGHVPVMMINARKKALR
jgi:hypothetical protein